MEAQVVFGDLLEQDVEVIVNSWNQNFIPWWLLLSQGVSGAIRRRAGTAPFRELARCGIIPLGGAVVTSAGKLNYKAIIHVAGINFFWRATKKSIQMSVRNAAALAARNGYKSMAIPIIGSGTGGFKADNALDLMQREFQQLDYPVSVKIIVYRRKHSH